VLQVTLRFYEELNDFLPEERRKRDFTVQLESRTSVKDLIESLGVPHVEVDLILADGESVGFGHIVEQTQRIAVYPVFESLDIGEVQHLRPRPLRVPRFVLDVHLGWLARRLRMLGFDCLYENDAGDDRLAQLSADEGRILLTRDRELLKRKVVTRGSWVRATDPAQQVTEILDRLDLRGAIRPFGRCPRCNGTLEEVDAAEVEDRVPAESFAAFDRFWRCAACGRPYWRGSHVETLEEWMRGL
jgi:uncharacterized protein with PIN domain